VSVFVDLSPLREFPAFKRYFFGQLVSVFASLLTVVAPQSRSATTMTLVDKSATQKGLCLSSIFISEVRGGPKLGEAESGIAASFGGLQFAAVSGGLLCLIWIAVVATAYPELRNWESKPT
jgi:hypothetical protein